MKTGLQLYSVRKEAKADFAGTMKKISDMGYDGVELAGFCELAPEEVRGIAEENKLEIISAHVSYVALRDDAEKTIQDYKTAGVKYIAIPAIPKELRPEVSIDGFTSTVDTFATIGEKTRHAGIQLLYHNHDFEFFKMDGEYCLDYIYRVVPQDVLKTEIDICWAKVGGVDPSEYIMKYSGRAPIVHLKDLFIEYSGEQTFGRNDTLQLRPVGHGIQNIPSVLNAAEKAGSEWVIVEQDHPTVGLTPLESAELSIKALHSFMNN